MGAVAVVSIVVSDAPRWVAVVVLWVGATGNPLVTTVALGFDPESFEDTLNSAFHVSLSTIGSRPS